MAGSLAFTESTLTISSGSVTAKRQAHVIAAETGVTDDLANIATGSVSDGAWLLIRPDTGDTITVKHAATGAGEIHLADDADFAMSSDMSLFLQRRGADWYELTRDELWVATQAEMEAGTSLVKAATAGRAHFHPSAAKFWVKFDEAGNADASYNVDSVTDNGTGDWTVNITNDFSSADYCCLGMAQHASTTVSSTLAIDFANDPTAGTVRVLNKNDGAVNSDPETDGTSVISVAGFGDL